MVNTSAGRQSEPEPGSRFSDNIGKTADQEVFSKRLCHFYFISLSRNIPGSHLSISPSPLNSKHSCVALCVLFPKLVVQHAVSFQQRVEQDSEAVRL